MLFGPETKVSTVLLFCFYCLSLFYLVFMSLDLTFISHPLCFLLFIGKYKCGFNALLDGSNIFSSLWVIILRSIMTKGTPTQFQKFNYFLEDFIFIFQRAIYNHMPACYIFNNNSYILYFKV